MEYSLACAWNKNIHSKETKVLIESNKMSGLMTGYHTLCHVSSKTAPVFVLPPL